MQCREADVLRDDHARVHASEVQGQDPVVESLLHLVHVAALDGLDILCGAHGHRHSDLFLVRLPYENRIHELRCRPAYHIIQGEHRHCCEVHAPLKDGDLLEHP